MYTRFYDDTVITRFIKALLAYSYIPLVRVWNPGDFVMRNVIYIHSGLILQANKTGVANKVSEFSVKSLYVPELSYHNINSNYISNINSYDPETHIWLGNYLRFIRDYYNLDLMPFYNCFSGEFASNITMDESGIKVGTSDERYKICMVPVKFGKVYNLAIDCDTSIEYLFGFYGPKGLIPDKTDILYSNEFGNTYTRIPSIQFVNPYRVNGIEWTEKIATTESISQFERYLKLFIKIPSNNKSSIVVIEGDISRESYLSDYSDSQASSMFQGINGVYTNLVPTCNAKRVDGTSVFSNTLYYEQRTAGSQNAIQSYTVIPTAECLSPLGLLQWSDGNIYAFSDRLIEYLVRNVISSQETITDNILRVQELISSYTTSNANLFPRYTSSYSPGVWDDSMQKYIYSLESYANTPKGHPRVDMNGFVDRDAESLINKKERVKNANK